MAYNRCSSGSEVRLDGLNKGLQTTISDSEINPADKSQSEKLSVEYQPQPGTSRRHDMQYRTPCQETEAAFVEHIDWTETNDQPPPKICPLSWNYVRWYGDLDGTSRCLMRDSLLNMDKTFRTNPRDTQVIRMHDDVEKIITDIAESIQEFDPRFQSKILRMGSAHNELKIGEPNEFDFSLELDPYNFFMDRSGACRATEYLLRIMSHENDCTMQVNGSDLEQFEKVVVSKEEVINKRVMSEKDSEEQLVFKWNENTMLNGLYISHRFSQLVALAMTQLQLPQNWIHGGFNRPDFSGIRFHYPANLLQFEHRDPLDGHVIQVSVDLTPLLKVPFKSVTKMTFVPSDLLDEYLHDHDLMPYTWLRVMRSSSHMAVTSSPAEEDWLRSLDMMSMPKRAIRICKILHSRTGLDMKRLISEEHVKPVLDFRKAKHEKNESIMNSLYEKIYSEISRDFFRGKPRFDVLLANISDQLVSWNDLGENIGSEPYISSYKFKKTILVLMALDPHGGKKWTEEDLPDIVVSTLMLVHDLSVHDRQINDFLYDTNTGKVDARSSKHEDVLQHDKIPTKYAHLHKNLIQCRNLVSLFRHNDKITFYNGYEHKVDKDELVCMMFQALLYLAEGKSPVEVTWERCLPENLLEEEEEDMKQDLIRADFYKWFLRKVRLSELLTSLRISTDML